MSWRASPSRCARRRASSRPRSRRHPANCAPRSMAWTKTISTPACSAAPIGCATAISPMRRRNAHHQRPAKPGPTVARCRPRRGQRSAASSPDTAINRAMDNLSRLRDQLAGLGGRPTAKARPINRPQGQGQQQGRASGQRRPRQGKPARSGGRTVRVGQGPVRAASTGKGAERAAADGRHARMGNPAGRRWQSRWHRVRQPGHRQHAHRRPGRGAATRPQPGRHAARDRPGIEPPQSGSQPRCRIVPRRASNCRR
jgi:hypothetical protein